MTNYDLKWKCSELETELNTVRETAVTNIRDYQVKIEELEKTIATLKNHIHGLEIVVEAYHNNLNTLWSVVRWQK